MHHSSTKPDSSPNATSAARLVTALARTLHKAAVSDSPAEALPVLRRLIGAQVLSGLSLPELYRERALVRRKHLLRLLAIEAGFRSWEHYRPELDGLRPDQLGHYELQARRQGYPNNWFSSVAEARDFAGRHGGRVVGVGTQAVVLSPTA